MCILFQKSLNGLVMKLIHWDLCIMTDEIIDKSANKKEN